MAILWLAVLSPSIPSAFAQSEVPLYIKYRYEKQTGRKWYDASPERQREFIQEIKEQRDKERVLKERKEIQRDIIEADKERVKQARDMRIEMRKQARLIRKANEERAVLLRKERLKMKKEALSRKMDMRRLHSQTR